MSIRPHRKTMAMSWQTIRIFVSSTFRDMQAERDYLMRFVFPRLRETLARRRIHLDDVDLRWGVTSDQNVLEVCRGIIDECRPRFLCLLGGRYGWVPPGGTQSITEDEVRYGVLDRLGNHGYAFFYFRDPKSTAAIEEPEPGFYREVSGGERAQQLETLKQAIHDAGLRPFEYPAQWDAATEGLVGLEKLGEQVSSDLLCSVDDEFGTVPTVAADSLEAERAGMEAAIQELRRQFVAGSRTELLDRIVAWSTRRDSPQVLVIYGPEGIGKSALLAACCHRLSASDESPLKGPWLVLSHFVGVTAGSNSLHQMLDRFSRDLGRFAAMDVEPPDELEALIHFFSDRLAQAAERGHVVLVADGIDELSETDEVRSARWLPRTLPPAARIIVSCAEPTVRDALSGRGNATILPVPPFTHDDARLLVHEFLARYGKRVSADQMGDILAKQGIDSPLYLITALEQLRTLGRYEEVTQRIRELPGQTDALFRWILQRLSRESVLRAEGDDVRTEDLVRNVASLLAASRGGLRAADLGTLVLPGDPAGRLAALLRLLRPHLTNRGALLDYRHPLFRRAACDEYLPTESRRVAIHRQLADHFRAESDPSGNGTWSGDHPCALRELPHHLTCARRWVDLYAVMTDFGYVEQRIRDVITTDRNYGTLFVVPRLDNSLVLQCGACGLSSEFDAAVPSNLGTATVRCRRCNNILRIARIRDSGPDELRSGYVSRCEGCGRTTRIPKRWLDGGIGVHRVVCSSCGMTSTEESTAHTRRRYRGGIPLHEDFTMSLAAWPEDVPDPGKRAVLGVFRESLRSLQSTWQDDPAMLFPQVYPYLYWVSGEARAECRRLCDGYTQRYGQRGPWLRMISPPRGSLHEIAFSTRSVVTAMCCARPEGPLVACTADARLLVVDLDHGRIDSVACGNHRLLAVGPAEQQRRAGALAVAEGGQVFAFDAESREVRLLGNAGDAVTAAIAVDGRLVATGSQWGEIVVWDPHNRARSGKATSRRSVVKHLCFSGSGESLIVVYAHGLAVILDTRSLRQKGTILARYARGVFLPAPPRDAWWFMSENGTLHRCTTQQRDSVLLPHLADERLTAVHVSGETGFAALGTASGKVRVLPVGSIDEAHVRSLPLPVVATLLTPDMRWVAAADEEGSLRIWRLDASTAAERGNEPRVASAPRRLLDGLVALGTSLGTCVCLSGAENEASATLSGELAFSGPAASAVATPVYVAAGNGGRWKAWNVQTRKPLGSAATAGKIQSLTVSADGEIVCTGSSTGVVAAWDTASGAERGRIEPSAAGVADIVFAPDGERLFAATEDAVARAWRVTADTHPNSREHRLIISLTNERESGPLRGVNFQRLWERQLDLRPSSLDITTDGQLLAVGARETIQLLAADDGRVIGEIASPEGTWTDVAFSPDDRRLLGVSDRGVVHVWQIDNGRRLGRYLLGATPIGCDWCAEGKELCVTDDEGRILWFAIMPQSPDARAPNGTALHGEERP